MNKTEQKLLSKNKALMASVKKGHRQIFDNRIVLMALEIVDMLQVLGMDPQPIRIGHWYGQMLNAAGSIAANYAEGLGKTDTMDFLKFCKIARGSAYETYVWSIISRDEKIKEKAAKLCELVDVEIAAYLKPLIGE